MSPNTLAAQVGIQLQIDDMRTRLQHALLTAHKNSLTADDWSELWSSESDLEPEIVAASKAAAAAGDFGAAGEFSHTFAELNEDLVQIIDALLASTPDGQFNVDELTS